MTDLRVVTELPATADLVVVGGGILGAATAFFAQLAGLRTVVIERRPQLATLTTAAAAGGFRAQFDNPDETALVQESIAVFDRFAALAGLDGYDIGLRRQGYLFVTTDSHMAQRQAGRVAQQHAWGVTDVELLNGDEVRYRFPYLSDSVVSGRFRASDGFVDPKRLTFGYARGSGATFVLDTAVTGFRLNGGRLAAVETSRGSIATDSVVLAAGPFSGILAQTAGLDLGITAVRRQKLIMPDVPDVPPTAPFVLDDDTGGHWRPAFGGSLLFFTDPATLPGEPSWDVPATTDFAFQLLDPSRPPSVARVTPFWRDVWARGIDHWCLQAGQYTYTHDHRPFLGPTSIPGFHLNLGYSGHGVMGSAGGSQRVVEMLTGRRDPSTNPFRWDRPVVPIDFDVV